MTGRIDRGDGHVFDGRKPALADGGVSAAQSRETIERLRERPRVGPAPVSGPEERLVGTLTAPPLPGFEIRSVVYLYGDERRAVRRFVEENEAYVRACMDDPDNPIAATWDDVLWALLCEEWDLGGFAEDGDGG